MNQYWWIGVEPLRALEALPGLAEHHQSILAQHQLRISAPGGAGLCQALDEAEGRGQIFDRARCVLVEQVRTRARVTLRRVLHLTRSPPSHSPVTRSVAWAKRAGMSPERPL